MLVQQRTSSGYLIITLEDCLKAELTIQRFRGRSPALFSSTDKNALIAALSTLVAAAGTGIRPTSNVVSLLKEVTFSAFALDINGQNAS